MCLFIDTFGIHRQMELVIRNLNAKYSRNLRFDFAAEAPEGYKIISAAICIHIIILNHTVFDHIWTGCNVSARLCDVT